MSKTRAYWERGIDLVPMVTGASTVMDCVDLRDAAQGLSIPLPFQEPLLDVGCGTGRLATLVSGPSQNYYGVDLSRDAVKYVKEQGLLARSIMGHMDLPMYHPTRQPFTWGAALSVFTHIPRDEMILYLVSLNQRARNLWCDIIPGDGSGDVVCWTKNETQFLADALACRWKPLQRYERTSPDCRTHVYFWLGRA